MTATDPLAYDDARTVADALLSLPGVTRLDAGRFGEKALLFPEERIPGLTYNSADESDSGRATLGVRAVVDLKPLEATGTDLHKLGVQIRQEAQRRLGSVDVDVTIADVAIETETAAAQESSSVATAVRR